MKTARIALTLLLAGITGILVTPGEEQATAIAETRAVTVEQYRHQELEAAFKTEANEAAKATSLSIAADLAVEVNAKPVPQLVAADTAHSDRG